MSIDQLLKDDKPEITEEQLGALGEAAAALVSKQEQIEFAERRIKELKAEERTIAQETIPALMDNLGFETITLNTGAKLSVKEMVQCSIPVALKPKAYKWLEEHGHGDLIKTEVSAKFARGEMEAANAAFEQLMDIGANPNQIVSVHPGTLKAWAREELSSGHALPEDIFKVHIVRQTVLK